MVLEAGACHQGEMGTFLFKLLISSGVIASTSWLAGKRPGLAGFLMALPISSLLAIAFTQTEWRDADKSVDFARSILLSVPLSLTFFLPFLFSKELRLPFWGQYFAGIALLAVSYGIHRAVFRE